MGSGRPVLFVHAGIVSGEAWLPAAKLVAASGRSAIVVDLRGFGASPDPEGPYSHVDDLVDALDDTGVAEVVVAGWSMGGAVACALAHFHPSCVRALALVNSVPEGFDRDPAVLASWEREEALCDAGRLDEVVRNDLETWVAGRGRTLADVPKDVVAHVEAALRDSVTRARDEHDAYDQTRAPSPGEVKGLTMPILAITSDFDYEDNYAAAAALREAGADVRFVEIDGCAHVGPLERPDAYAAALSGFLDDLSW
jgi:3-oxoadipate enol-lactonase